MTPRRTLLSAGLALLLLLAACSAPRAARDLPPTWVWERDQDRIHADDGTLNAWEGFAVKPGRFECSGESAQFILWRRRAAPVELSVEYSLQGRPATLTVNGAAAQKLAPGSGFRRHTFRASLSSGFNFLRFARKGKGVLQVRAVTVGAGRSRPHLRPGESVSFFLGAGSGRIELRGGGRVRIEEQALDDEPPPAAVRERRSGLFSRRIRHELAAERPTAVRVTCLRGELSVGSFAFRPAPPPPPPAHPRLSGRPDITIILADACQPSHLGAYGYGRNTSPHIDALAADAVVYENAHANASFTRSSVATLLTGLYPDSHKVRVLQHGLPTRLLTLPEYLNARGYRTGVFSSSTVVAPHFGLNQGVERFANVRGLKFDGNNPLLLGKFSDWWRRVEGPRFTYVHFLQPHLPTVPPPSFPLPFVPEGKVPSYARMIELAERGKHPDRPFSADDVREITLGYDASIAWTDGEIGKIIAMIKERGLYDDSLIVFLADHGEALREHGVVGHGSNVYEETTRVPLIVKYPRSLGLRGRAAFVCEVADVFPTISSLFGHEIELDGRSLLARADARALDDHMAVSRSFNPIGLYGMRWRNWYHIISTKTNRQQLYRLGADPLLEVGGRYPQAALWFKARFLDWLGRFRDRGDFSVETNLRKLPAGDIDEMKTLGYL